MAARRQAPRGPVEVLEERARALARPIAPPPAGDTLQAITFALAGETYAIESRYVIEVFRLKELSPLPGAEAPVFAVTAWRGALLVMLDLRSVLGLPISALNDLSRVIVMGTDRPAFGILADAVRDLVTFTASEVRPRAEGVAASGEYVRGVTTGAVLVLDAGRLLSLHT